MQKDNPQSGRSNYLDFELEIGEGRGREYPVVVLDSPAGEARETMHFPFDELALENRLLNLQNVLLRSGGKHRRVPSQEEQAVQDFGQALFDTLISGEIRSYYDMSLREATRRDKGLRLKVRIRPPELNALPWEFMYDSRQAEYVCLSRRTPIVRYLESPRFIKPLTVAPPLRILGMIASPKDQPALDLEREKQRVEQAIQGLQARGLVELEWLEGQTWRDLQRAMWGGPWHVFHFVGHGGFDVQTDEGFIALADSEGRTDCLSATRLGRLLADHPALRLVLLNSCEGAKGSERDVFSSAASILVRRGIPAVLAMQYAITDRAAVELARAFYEALAYGMAVDEAVVAARKAISLAMTNTVEWGTPVLYTCAPDGVLFQVTGVPPPGTEKVLDSRLEIETRKKPDVLVHPTSFWRRLPRWAMAAIGGLALVAVVVAAVLLFDGLGGEAPQATPTSALAAVVATDTPSLTPTRSPESTSTPVLASDTPHPLMSTSAPTMTYMPTSTPTLSSTPEPSTTSVPVPTSSPEIVFAAIPTGRQADGGLFSIYTVNSDGEQSIRLPSDEGDKHEWYPRWMPDKKTIIYVKDEGEHNNFLWRMNADGSERRLLYPNAQGMYPALSPDGKYLAFVREQDGNTDVFVTDLTGSEVRQLTYHSKSDSHPDWSPDGTRIVFDTLRSGVWEIYVMNADGSNLKNLTERTMDTNPAWSPDGRYIAFLSSRDGNLEIYVMNADGSNEKRVTGHSANDVDANWTSDGRIIFTSDRDGDFEIYLVNRDGTELVKLTDNSRDDRWPDWSFAK